jgi:hypothetical protein
MALSYELGGIENWRELLGDDNQPQPKTHAMIFATISAGIGLITEENHIEFWMRVAASDAISVWPKGEPITLKDVKRHIGLRTNVSKEARATWAKRIFESTEREIRYRARRDAEKAAKEAEDEVRTVA